jgi:glycosyltransferase involved in cell wall biosynthesis
VGRLVAQKDHDTLLRAFAVSGLAGRAHLLILGEGPLRPKLEALAAQLRITDDVCFAGAVPDVYPYLRRATGFVLSSRYEGLPLALVEALSAGLPIVAVDCLTGPAEILQGGRLGRLVSAGDTDGLAQAMKDMVSGHLQPAPPSEVSRHIARFDPQRIAGQYVDLVRHCLRIA